MQVSSALPFAPGAILLALVTLQVAQPNGNGRKAKPGQKTAGMGSSQFIPSSRRTWSSSSISSSINQASLNRNIYSAPAATAVPRSKHHSVDLRTTRGSLGRGQTQMNMRAQPAQSYAPITAKKGPYGRIDASQASGFAIGFLNHDSSTQGDRDFRIPVTML